MTEDDFVNQLLDSVSTLNDEKQSNMETISRLTTQNLEMTTQVDKL